jgi:hypothetical protein
MDQRSSRPIGRRARRADRKPTVPVPPRWAGCRHSSNVAKAVGVNDERCGTVSRPALSDRLVSGRIDLQHIGGVYFDDEQAEGSEASAYVAREVHAARCALRPPVVLEHDQERQPPQRGEVEGSRTPVPRPRVPLPRKATLRPADSPSLRASAMPAAAGTIIAIELGADQQDDEQQRPAGGKRQSCTSCAR